MTQKMSESWLQAKISNIAKHFKVCLIIFNRKNVGSALVALNTYKVNKYNKTSANKKYVNIFTYIRI